MGFVDRVILYAFYGPAGEVRDRLSIFEDDMSSFDDGADPAKIQDIKDFFAFPSLEEANFFSRNSEGPQGGIFERTKKTVQGETLYSALVPFAPNTPIDIDFNLFTGVNVGLFNVDFFGQAIVRGFADFDKTATLVSVSAYDTNMQLIDPSTYSLISEQGLQYPVPEPASFTLLGIGFLVACRRGRNLP